jgi:hypothetical protein
MIEITTQMNFLRRVFYCHSIFMSLLPVILVMLAFSIVSDKAMAEDPYIVPIEKNLGKIKRLKGASPRVFLTKTKVHELRLACKTSLKEEWATLQGVADSALKHTPPTNANSKPPAFNREYGNELANLSFAWLLSQNPDNLNAASNRATLLASSTNWAYDNKTGKPANTGLVIGHLLLGLSMYYDYARNEIDPPNLTLVRETLRQRASAVADCLKQGTWNYGHALQSNHTWVYSAGIMAAGLSLLDEEPAAREWIGQALSIMRMSDNLLSPDGVSQEGFGYYQYGMEYLLKLFTMAEGLGFSEGKSPWWSNTANYIRWMMIPRNSWSKDNSQVDFADADRWPWYGPGYLLHWLGRRNQDGEAQWLADEIVRSGIDNSVSPWLAMLWKDTSLTSYKPSSTPTLHHFENMGIVGSRSDWSGDEALLLLKTGNPIGNYAFQKHREYLNRGEYYHIHSDVNHFCLFGAGEWLIRNAGYGRRTAHFQNTLTIDDRGQIGDPDVPMPWPLTDASRFAHIVSVSSTNMVDRIVGDATAAYAPEAGLESYLRELIFIKPDVVVVVDRIKTKSEKKLTLRFHPEAMPLAQPDYSWLCSGQKSILRVESLYSNNAKASSETIVGKSRNSRPTKDLYCLRFDTNASQWLQITAFSWGKLGIEPQRVSLEKSGTSAFVRTQQTRVNIGDLDIRY